VGHRGDADAELAGNGTQGLATADGGYLGTTTLALTLCLLMGLSPEGSTLGECSPPLFGIYWHKTVRDQLALTPLSD